MGIWASLCFSNKNNNFSLLDPFINYGILSITQGHVKVYNKQDFSLLSRDKSVRLANIGSNILFQKHISDRVCIKGPLVGRYETEISAVKVNWPILVGFTEILQSGSLFYTSKQ